MGYSICVLTIVGCALRVKSVACDASLTCQVTAITPINAIKSTSTVMLTERERVEPIMVYKCYDEKAWGMLSRVLKPHQEMPLESIHRHSWQSGNQTWLEM
eukprot:1155348-Pelagomonas_calceolata.AAC.3